MDVLPSSRPVHQEEARYLLQDWINYKETMTISGHSIWTVFFGINPCNNYDMVFFTFYTETVPLCCVPRKIVHRSTLHPLCCVSKTNKRGLGKIWIAGERLESKFTYFVVLQFLFANDKPLTVNSRDNMGQILLVLTFKEISL